MKKPLLQIIKEEISNYFSDWQMNDEPSVADKYYEKLTGQAAQQQPQEPAISGEKIGYVNKMWGKDMKTPVAVYKNPTSLQGFESFARGILVANGDFYLAQNDKALHDDFLELLASRGIVPLGKIHRYFEEYPAEFIAVQRAANTNKFTQSSAYDEFPFYYDNMFDEANKKHTAYQFLRLGLREELNTDTSAADTEDPNWMISSIPQGYKHNIVDEIWEAVSKTLKGIKEKA